MARFKKKTKPKVEISTASLPDIVFMMLFFFMVTATIRPEEQLVQAKIPQARELNKVEKEQLLKEISVGKPNNKALGQEPKITVGDRFIAMKDIPQWVSQQRDELPEYYKEQMIILLRADEDLEMGIIADIMEELKKANARKILYRTLDKVE